MNKKNEEIMEVLRSGLSMNIKTEISISLYCREQLLEKVEAIMNPPVKRTVKKKVE